MHTVTTTSPDSELRANLAKEIAEALATGKPDFPVRTPAHRSDYTPLIDLVSEAIGAPNCPILTALLALVAGGLKSSDAAIVAQANAALQAISAAHVESQIDAAIQEDADAVGFVPAPWTHQARRAAA